jgi:hypothetical protein
MFGRGRLRRHRCYGFFMYELKQALIVRALGVLRASPLTAAQFARKMWSDRDRQPGRESQAGYALLRQLAAPGYVERVGDLWRIRRFAGVSRVASADRSADGPAVELPDLLPNRPHDDWLDPQLDLPRLHRMVRMANAPVDGVTHDGVLGDIRVKGHFLNNCVAEACAIVVLFGKTANIYPACDSEMTVGLRPIEAARALFLRWQQSGVATSFPDEDRWLRADDGLIAVSDCFIPAGQDPDNWVEEEPIDERIQRQRLAAGLA